MVLLPSLRCSSASTLRLCPSIQWYRCHRQANFVSFGSGMELSGWDHICQIARATTSNMSASRTELPASSAQMVPEMGHFAGYYWVNTSVVYLKMTLTSGRQGPAVVICASSGLFTFGSMNNRAPHWFRARPDTAQVSRESTTSLRST